MSYYDEVDYALASLDKDEQDRSKTKRVDGKEYVWIEDPDVWHCCFCGSYADKIEGIKHCDNCKEEHYDYNE